MINGKLRTSVAQACSSFVYKVYMYVLEKKLSSDLYGNILAQGPTFYLTPILHVISFHGRGSYSCMFFSKLYNNLLDFLQKNAHSC